MTSAMIVVASMLAGCFATHPYLDREDASVPADAASVPADAASDARVAMEMDGGARADAAAADLDATVIADAGTDAPWLDASRPEPVCEALSCPWSIGGVCDPPVRVATGPGSSCAVRASGRVACWGSGGDRSAPYEVPGVVATGTIALPAYAGCAIDSGRVRCWGENGYGSLGRGFVSGERLGAGDVLGIDDANDLAAGFARVCALRSSGEVWCWGNDGAHPASDDYATPAPLPQVSGAIDVSGSMYRACALEADGDAWCWTGDPDAIPERVATVPGAIAVSATGNVTCFLQLSGEVRCMGLGGEVGDGTGVTRSTPVAIGIDDAVALMGSSANTCALRGDGSVWCWGTITYRGSLDPEALRPTMVALDDSALAIGGGDWSSCAALASGHVECWADIAFLASAEATADPRPWRGAQGTNVLVAADDGHYCVAVDGAPVRCMEGRPETAIAGTEGAVQLEVSPSENTLCVRRADGSVWCSWSGTDASRVAEIDGAVDVAVTDRGSCSLPDCYAVPGCAVLHDSSVWCWGEVPGRDRTEVPTRLEGPVRARAIEAGLDHVCVLDVEGHVWCFGDNAHRQLGADAPESSAELVRVSGVSRAVSIEAAGDHTCALSDDGRVTCWGDSSFDGGRGELAADVGLAGIVEIVTGRLHGCALRSNGTVACWGRANHGALGPAGLDARAVEPVEVPAITCARSISAGAYSTCADTGEERLACWGTTRFGLLPRYVPPPSW